MTALAELRDDTVSARRPDAGTALRSPSVRLAPRTSGPIR